MKKMTIGKISIIIVSSLLVWAFYYVKNLPLQTEETAFVVFVCTIIVVLADKLLKRKQGDQNDKIP